MKDKDSNMNGFVNSFRLHFEHFPRIIFNFQNIIFFYNLLLLSGMGTIVRVSLNKEFSYFLICYILHHILSSKKINKWVGNFANKIFKTIDEDCKNRLYFTKDQVLKFLKSFQVLITFLLTIILVAYFFKFDARKKGIMLFYSVILFIIIFYLIIEWLIVLVYSFFSNQIYHYKFRKRFFIVFCFTMIIWLLNLLLSDTELSEFIFTIGSYQVCTWFLSDDKHILFKTHSSGNPKIVALLRTLLIMGMLSFSLSKLLIDKSVFPVPFFENIFSELDNTKSMSNLMSTVLIFLLLYIILILSLVIRYKKLRLSEQSMETDNENNELSEVEKNPKKSYCKKFPKRKKENNI